MPEATLPEPVKKRIDKKFLLITAGVVVVIGALLAFYILWLRPMLDKGQNNNSSHSQNPSQAGNNLPSLSYFQTHPSDQFLVDMDIVQTGHPFKGSRANDPHAGAHVQFGDEYKTWPRGGTAPSDYPKIYAVADGVVSMVTYSLPVAGNDRYGLSLAIAKDNGNTWYFEYSIEPFLKEPAKDFYKQFLLVKDGDKVKKGQVIAYMYLAAAGASGEHIHFHLRRDGSQGFYAPAIFTKDIVQQFHDHWGSFGSDKGTPMGVCMGWKLTAEENPFGTGAVDCLE